MWCRNWVQGTQYNCSIEHMLSKRPGLWSLDMVSASSLILPGIWTAEIVKLKSIEPLFIMPCVTVLSVWTMMWWSCHLYRQRRAARTIAASSLVLMWWGISFGQSLAHCEYSQSPWQNAPPAKGHASLYSISQEICTQFCCALLCCGYAIVHNEFTWSIYPYSSGLLCWHWGNR